MIYTVFSFYLWLLGWRTVIFQSFGLYCRSHPHLQIGGLVKASLGLTLLVFTAGMRGGLSLTECCHANNGTSTILEALRSPAPST